MTEVNQGRQVKINYKGTLQDGTVFDQSKEGEPLEFTIGEGKIIPGLEKAVAEMEVGESKTVEVPSDEAYGPHREELIGKIPRDRLPDEINPEVGQMLRVGQQEGETMVVQVVEVTDDEVALDGNHPLAGHDLTFEVELLEAV